MYSAALRPPCAAPPLEGGRGQRRDVGPQRPAPARAASARAAAASDRQRPANPARAVRPSSSRRSAAGLPAVDRGPRPASRPRPRNRAPRPKKNPRDPARPRIAWHIARCSEPVPYTEVDRVACHPCSRRWSWPGPCSVSAVRSAQAQDWTDYLHWPYVPPQVPGNGFEYQPLYDRFYLYPREQRIVPQIQGPYYRNFYGGKRILGLRNPHGCSRLEQEEVLPGPPLLPRRLLSATVDGPVATAVRSAAARPAGERPRSHPASRPQGAGDLVVDVHGRAGPGPGRSTRPWCGPGRCRPGPKTSAGIPARPSGPASVP